MQVNRGVYHLMSLGRIICSVGGGSSLVSNLKMFVMPKKFKLYFNLISGQDEDNIKDINQEKKTQDINLPVDDSEQSTHFLAYFICIALISIVGYIAFHNKQKVR